MEIKTEIQGDKALLVLKGKLTVQTSSQLNAAAESLPEQVCCIDLDLADVNYIASAGLRVLVAADKLAAKRGGNVRLLHPRDDVMETFEMTGLAEVFSIER